MDKKTFYDELEKRQAEHLKEVTRRATGGEQWKPCRHDLCTECHGTGVRLDGTPCMHALHCDCPKCAPRCGQGPPSHTVTVRPMPNMPVNRNDDRVDPEFWSTYAPCCAPPWPTQVVKTGHDLCRTVTGRLNHPQIKFINPPRQTQ
jgi:hypothetical protein